MQGFTRHDTPEEGHLALELSAEGFTLHRAGMLGVWRQTGFAALDAPDLAAAMAGLRAAVGGPRAVRPAVEVWLPADQVSLAPAGAAEPPATGPDGSIGVRVEAPSGGAPVLAHVPARTVAETVAFLDYHGFTVTGFSTRQAPPGLSAPPRFPAPAPPGQAGAAPAPHPARRAGLAAAAALVLALLGGAGWMAVSGDGAPDARAQAPWLAAAPVAAALPPAPQADTAAPRAAAPARLAAAGAPGVVPDTAGLRVPRHARVQSAAPGGDTPPSPAAAPAPVAALSPHGGGTAPQRLAAVSSADARPALTNLRDIARVRVDGAAAVASDAAARAVAGSLPTLPGPARTARRSNAAELPPAAAADAPRPAPASGRAAPAPALTLSARAPAGRAADAGAPHRPGTRIAALPPLRVAPRALWAIAAVPEPAPRGTAARAPAPAAPHAGTANPAPPARGDAAAPVHLTAPAPGVAPPEAATPPAPDLPEPLPRTAAGTAPAGPQVPAARGPAAPPEAAPAARSTPPPERPAAPQVARAAQTVTPALGAGAPDWPGLNTLTAPVAQPEPPALLARLSQPLRAAPAPVLRPQAATVAEDPALAPSPRALARSDRPRQRPEAIEATAEALAARMAAAAPSDLALTLAPPPRPRPGGFARRAVAALAPDPAPQPQPQPQPEREPRRAAPPEPTPTSVARAATIDNALPMRQLVLVGVYGGSSSRHALVRLPSGRYVKVAPGDSVEGYRVAAIGSDAIRIRRGGRDTVLEIPE